MASQFLHVAKAVVGLSVIGTDGSHDGLAGLRTHAIGDALLVDVAILAIIAAEQFALIQA